MQEEIFGKFNGHSLVDDVGHKYLVTPNYASKSMMVEGDKLKLAIQHDGTFVFKQINPVPRKRVIGTYETDENNNNYIVIAEERYRVLRASVTYHQLEYGDKVVCVAPATGDYLWVVVENKL